jgi:hypothetical protein
VEIAQRRAASEGLTEQPGRDLATLELKPAGALLETLRRLDIPRDLVNVTTFGQEARECKARLSEGSRVGLSGRLEGEGQRSDRGAWEESLAS